MPNFFEVKKMLSANEMQEKISKKLPTIFIMKGNTNFRMSYIYYKRFIIGTRHKV